MLLRTALLPRQEWKVRDDYLYMWLFSALRDLFLCRALMNFPVRFPEDWGGNFLTADCGTVDLHVLDER